MNLTRSFVQFLEDNGFGTFGIDIFIGGVPVTAPNKSMWVLSGGGTNLIKNVTGDKQKNYIISIFYRNLDGQDVYDKLQQLEELFNNPDCIELEGYNIVEIEATQFPTDQDLDNEDRTVGLIQATLTLYRNLS